MDTKEWNLMSGNQSMNEWERMNETGYEWMETETNGDYNQWGLMKIWMGMQCELGSKWNENGAKWKRKWNGIGM